MALLTAIVVLSAALMIWGTSSSAGFLDASLAVSRLGVGLAGDSFAALKPNGAGSLIQIIARIALPVLLGLMALSIRGRVKR